MSPPTGRPEPLGKGYVVGGPDDPQKARGECSCHWDEHGDVKLYADPNCARCIARRPEDGR